MLFLHLAENAFIRRVLAVVGALSALVLPRQALALPSIAIRNVARNVVTHPDQTTYNWISRSDCLADDVFQFSVILTDAAGTELDVWVSAGAIDCTNRIERTLNRTCLRVFAGLSTPLAQTIEIRAEDIAALDTGVSGPAGVGSGTADSCWSNKGGTSAHSMTLYFMLIASGDVFAGAFWSTKLDLVGPSPPTDVALGIGDALLDVVWNPNQDPDVARYYVFCDPPPGGTSAASPPQRDCSTPAAFPLAQNQLPTPDFVAKYQCGEVRGNTSGHTTLTGLTNGSATAVAVAAVDAVGNVGALSNVPCGAPERVQDPDPNQLDRGGGCFCSIGHRPGQRAGWSGIGLAILGLRARRTSARRVTWPIKLSRASVCQGHLAGRRPAAGSA